MKLSDFNKCYQELNQRVEKMLLTKREEYASGEDRLANFKHPTSLLETNPAMVCMYYQTKHFDSLIDICKKIDQGVYPSKELILEKAGDLAAYTYLLYACLQEQMNPLQKNAL